MYATLSGTKTTTLMYLSQVHQRKQNTNIQHFLYLEERAPFSGFNLGYSLLSRGVDLILGFTHSTDFSEEAFNFH